MERRRLVRIAFRGPHAAGGPGLCDSAAVETIVREGPESGARTIRLGTRFTRVEGNDIDSELEYDLGQEGGHSIAACFTRN